ncbi:MAG: hypothetical protein JXA42_04195 [Anaerolineales bacterium]|nr:hypothetical protein [Anaerolineales bacterium]
MGRLIISWTDLDALLEHLLPQFYGVFDAILMVARGGIVPGGLIAERLGTINLYTTAVSFPADSPEWNPVFGMDYQTEPVSQAALQKEFILRSMPEFLHFPPDDLIRDRRILVVNHVWNHGRSITAVAGKVLACGGKPELCVLHFKPGQSVFTRLKPDYYAAVTSDFVVYPWEAAHRLEPYRPMPLTR